MHAAGRRGALRASDNSVFMETKEEHVRRKVLEPKGVVEWTCSP
jgi:hypothetical protein